MHNKEKEIFLECVRPTIWIGSRIQKIIIKRKQRHINHHFVPKPPYCTLFTFTAGDWEQVVFFTTFVQGGKNNVIDWKIRLMFYVIEYLHLHNFLFFLKKTKKIIG